MKAPKKDITKDQMACMHIAYREYARLLNESGMTIQLAIELGKIRLPIGFTEENVKEMFAKPIMESLYPEKFKDGGSHSRLKTTESQLLFETLNAAMAEVFGISIPFPEKPKDEKD